MPVPASASAPDVLSSALRRRAVAGEPIDVAAVAALPEAKGMSTEQLYAAALAALPLLAAGRAEERPPPSLGGRQGASTAVRAKTALRADPEAWPPPVRTLPPLAVTRRTLAPHEIRETETQVLAALEAFRTAHPQTAAIAALHALIPSLVCMFEQADKTPARVSNGPPTLAPDALPCKYDAGVWLMRALLADGSALTPDPASVSIPVHRWNMNMPAEDLAERDVCVARYFALTPEADALACAFAEESVRSALMFGGNLGQVCGVCRTLAQVQEWQGRTESAAMTRSVAEHLQSGALRLTNTVGMVVAVQELDLAWAKDR